MSCPINKIAFFTSKAKFVRWLKELGCDAMAEEVKKRQCVGHAFFANSVICSQVCRKYPCNKSARAFFIEPPTPFRVTIDEVGHEIAHTLGDMSHGTGFSKLFGEVWEHLLTCNSCRKRFGNLEEEEFADPWLPTSDELEELKRDTTLPSLDEVLGVL